MTHAIEVVTRKETGPRGDSRYRSRDQKETGTMGDSRYRRRDQERDWNKG